jgi:chromosome segregation ATPase
MSERAGILQALWRFIKNLRQRKALQLNRAANEQYTGSVTGMSDAFDLERDQKVQEYKQLESAVAEVENVIENKRLELERLNYEEKDLLRKREGALALAEKSQVEGNNDAFVQHRAAFERFQSRINEVEERQKSLSEQIKQYEESMKKYMLQLTKMQAYIQSLPAQKAEAIADFVSAQRIIELNHRLMGIKTSFEAGPVSLVLEENRRLTAQARVSEKMAGTSVELQDTMYAEAGRSSESGDVFARMLAARKAQRETQAAPAEKVKVEEAGGKGNDRPSI